MINRTHLLPIKRQAEALGITHSTIYAVPRQSVEYEEVYLHAYNTVSGSRTGSGRYFNRYNQRRPHSSLNGGSGGAGQNRDLTTTSMLSGGAIAVGIELLLRAERVMHEYKAVTGN